MRKTWILTTVFMAAFFAFTALQPEPAEARCKMFNASHNGTDMFYDTGTEGTVKHKLYGLIEQWRVAKGIKRVRMGKVSMRCGKWFIKYMLPHRNCKAKARVCY